MKYQRYWVAVPTKKVAAPRVLTQIAFLCLGLLTIASQIQGAAILWAPDGTITDLGAGTAMSINNQNQVLINRGQSTYVYTPGLGSVDIGSNGGGRTFGWSINDAGAVVGSSNTVTGVENAFYWSASTGMIDLGVYGFASGINDSGQVVGYAWTPGNINPVRGFQWNLATGISSINSPYSDTWMFDINDSGQVAGGGYGNGLPSNAFVYSEGVGFQAIDLSPWSFRRSVAISNSGTVVGYVDMNGVDIRAFVWSASAGAFVFPAGSAARATAISNTDKVVGILSNGKGFLWSQNGALQELPFRPNGINDAGYIVGESDETVVVGETPEPSTWALFALSGCVLAVFRQRLRR